MDVPRKTALRLGVLQGGRITDERVLRAPRNVTVGSGPENHVVVAGAGLGKWKLVERRKGTLRLRFTEDMEGQCLLAGGVVELAAARALGLAQREGRAWSVELPPGCQGKVRVAPGVSVLFQFVTPPAAVPRARLPPEVRGGVLRSLEPLYTSLLVASLSLTMGGAAWLRGVDAPPPPRLEDLGERAARFVAPRLGTLPPPKPPVVAAPPTAAPPKEPPAKPKQGGTVARSKGSAREAVQGKGLLVLLAKGGGAGIGAVLGPGGPTQGLQELMHGLTRVELATAGAPGLRGPGGDPEVVDVGMPGPHVPGVPVAPPRAPGPRPTVSAGDIRTDGDPTVMGTMDPKELTRAIRARMAGFKACYESALKRTRDLQGKLTIAFVVGEDGRVTDARVEQDNLQEAEVGQCVARLFRRMRFPPPEDGAVEASFPFVFVPSG